MSLEDAKNRVEQVKANVTARTETTNSHVMSNAAQIRNNAAVSKPDEQIDKKQLAAHKKQFKPVGLNLKTNIAGAGSLYNRTVNGVLCGVQEVHIKGAGSIYICNYPTNKTVVRYQRQGYSVEAVIHHSEAAKAICVRYFRAQKPIAENLQKFVSLKKVIELLVTMR
jgi:hypothetical protein